MGERFKFNYTTTKKRFQTKLGGFITILILMLSLAGFVYISSQYFDTSSPIVNSSRELSNSARRFNVYGKGLFPGFILASNGVTVPLKMNNFITAQGQIIKKAFDPFTNATEVKLSKRYNYVPCGSISSDEPVRALIRRISEADPNIFLCPRFEDVDDIATISNDPESLSSAYLVVKVYPCSLPDKNECFPKKKIFGASLSTGEIVSLR